MIERCIGGCLAVVLAISLAACKSRQKRHGPETAAEMGEVARAPAGSSAEPNEPRLPVAPATTAALSKAMRALTDAAREPAREAAIAKELVLEAPAAFFAATFGDAVGARLATGYEQHARAVATFATTIRVNQSKHKRHKITVERFSDAADPRATGLQAMALAAMVKPTPLYSVRYTSLESAGELHLFNFAHDGARFRYVGPLVELGGDGPGEAEMTALRRRQGKR